MKKYHYYIVLLITSCFLFQSCADILNTIPKDTLTDYSVWNNPEAIKAYLGKMYDRIPVEDFNFVFFEEAGFPSTVCDEAVRSYGWGAINEMIIPDNGFDWWGYNQIREANIFLDRIKTAPVEESLRINYEAEGRFIRAFYYFALVKRYGGVPLITVAQEYTGDVEELQVPRNTEKEIYEFIRTELDDIIAILPESWDASNRFRVTRYGALALKSRAMLYAASSATYAYLQMDGLVGMPVSDKEYYWKESKTASEAIMNSGKFALYNEYNDAEENFQQLFLDKTQHSEAIFMKAYIAPDKAHSFDFYNAPQSFKVDYGCATNPVIELVESFEYKDGSEGTLKISDEQGNPIQYDDPKDLFVNKDPRFLASVLYPFADWQGSYVEIRKGIIDGDNVITSSNLLDTYGSGENQITIVGRDGTLDLTDPTKTGFYIKKFMNPAERVSYNRSETYWMIFRYGEILLNYAEACIELGEPANALYAVNLIRRRAGMPEKTAVDVQDIRQERKVELTFENHRWWDIRRWRIADQVLNNTQFHSLYPYLVWEEGKHPSEMKYIFRIEPTPKNPRTFLPKLYSIKITESQIQSNPLLLQNPGY